MPDKLGPQVLFFGLPDCVSPVELFRAHLLTTLPLAQGLGCATQEDLPYHG